MGIEQCLVGSDDVLAGVQQPDDAGSRGFNAAHKMNDRLNVRILHDGLKVRGDRPGRQVHITTSAGVTHHNSAENQTLASLSLQQVCGRLQDADDTAPNRTTSDKAQTNGGHV
jgi:hypothetical protein